MQFVWLFSLLRKEEGVGSEVLKPLTLRAAARELGVTHRTLGIWISTGEGPRAFRYTHPTGRVTVRINPADWRAFMQKHLRGGR